MGDLTLFFSRCRQIRRRPHLTKLLSEAIKTCTVAISNSIHESCFEGPFLKTAIEKIKEEEKRRLAKGRRLFEDDMDFDPKELMEPEKKTETKEMQPPKRKKSQR